MEVNDREIVDKIEWSEKFNKGGRSGLHPYQDKGLIDSLIDVTEDFNHTMISEINEETTGYSKHDRVPYRRLRDTADVLGIPPWLLISEHENNEIVNKMYEEEADPLHEYKISTVGDLISTLEKLTIERQSDKFHLARCRRIIDEFRNLSSKHDYIRDIWADILKHIEHGITRDVFDWAARILLTRNLKESHRITIRVLKKGIVRYPKKVKTEINVFSIWLLITPIEFCEHDDDENTYLIDKIKKDICHLLNNNKYWTIETTDTGSTWYGWHSHRTDVKVPSLVASRFSERIRKYNSGNLQYVNNLHDYFFQGSSWLSQDERLSAGAETALESMDSKLEPLKYLYTIGYIGEGSRLVIAPYKSEQYYGTFAPDDKRCFARIVIDKNALKLQWEYDGELYGLNQLCNIIIDIYKLSMSAHRGSDFWMLENGSVTLYAVATQARQAEDQLTIWDL